MAKKTLISDIIDQVKTTLPKAGEVLCKDVPHLVEEGLKKAFHKLDLVTKEELETQKTVLKRMQDKIARLEEKLKNKRE